MALTILKRPSGCRLSDTPNNTYSISSDGYGTAILSGGSGLTTGQTIFIYNSYSSYNGFWVITSYGPGAFRLQRYSGASYLEYAQSIAVTIYPCVATVKYSAVHLPIVYTLGSTLWPINTTDSYRSVVGFHNDNGFIRLTLSGSIDAEALDWLRVSASSEDSLDGPFQILTKYSPTQFTISAPWSIAAASAYTFLAALVQKYYHNYTAHIRVYGGLPTTHLWYALKPYELIVEYKVNPDEAAIIKMNVADILKEKIEILLNRPNFDSMPYDLDRFAFFYIEYAESYDDSDGATVTTSTSSYQSDFDFFQGVAVDAKLEFKNRYSGLMSKYQYASLALPAKFLTEANRPVIFDGWYFDLSVINSFGVSELYLVQDVYNENGPSISTILTLFSGVSSEGILRLPLTVVGGGFYQIVYLTSPEYVLASTLWTQSGSLTFATPNSATFTLTTASAGTFIATQAAVLRSGSTFPAITFAWISNNARTGTYSIETNTAQVLTSGSISGTSTNFVIPATVLNSDITSYTITVNLNAGVSSILVLTIVELGDILGFDYVNLLTEQKRIDIWQKCHDQYIYLTWKNNLPGFDHWLFTANKDYNVNILETQEKDKNIYPQWDESYNEFSDTLKQEVSRRSRNEVTVRSQNLTRDQIEYIKGIKSSALVMQMTSKYDRRRVMLDTSGFTVRGDEQRNAFEIQFTIIYTDEIPSQSL